MSSTSPSSDALPVSETLDPNLLVRDYIELFNHPSGDMEVLSRLVTEDVHFRDPFKDIVGRQAFAEMLAHFNKSVRSPKFSVQHQWLDGDRVILRWDFRGEVALIGDWSFPGVSELRLGSCGRICEHLDYWDSGEHFYGRLPVVGPLIRWLRAKAGA